MVKGLEMEPPQRSPLARTPLRRSPLQTGQAGVPPTHLGRSAASRLVRSAFPETSSCRNCIETGVEIVLPGDWCGIPHAKWHAVRVSGRIVAIIENGAEAIRFARVLHATLNKVSPAHSR